MEILRDVSSSVYLRFNGLGRRQWSTWSHYVQRRSSALNRPHSLVLVGVLNEPLYLFLATSEYRDFLSLYPGGVASEPMLGFRNRFDGVGRADKRCRLNSGVRACVSFHRSDSLRDQPGHPTLTFLYGKVF